LVGHEGPVSYIELSSPSSASSIATGVDQSFYLGREESAETVCRSRFPSY
jgi:hypothetical protein